MTKVVGQKVCLQLIKSPTKSTHVFSNIWKIKADISLLVIYGLHGLGIKVHTRLLVQQEHV